MVVAHPHRTRRSPCPSLDWLATEHLDYSFATPPGVRWEGPNVKNMIRMIVVVLLAVPVFAADPPAVAVWRAAELETRNQALSKKVGPDHSSRETLADYGHHRLRFLYRDADGNPEQHDNIVDIVFVQSGEGTLVSGGTMVGRRQGSGPGEWLGTKLEGGDQRPIATGDVIHLPAKIPHSFLVPKGKHLTYVLVKFPAE